MVVVVVVMVVTVVVRVVVALVQHQLQSDGACQVPDGITLLR